MNMGKELLLEIGTEEIPAGFLPKAISDLEEMIGKALAGERIAHGEARALATPRRLCLTVADVAVRQEDQLVEKMGPARKVAFDEAGNPTKALLGFARGQGLDVAELETVTTEKGEYLCARKRIVGVETASLLPGLLAKLIVSVPFKKTMRWSSFDLRFPRPIHWILALYGGEVVPISVENVASGRETRGHRFMSPEPAPVKGFEDYRDVLRKKSVIVDPEERKRIIREEARKAAAAVGGRPLENEDLLETVAFLVEYPTVVCGGFDPAYLDLPGEVLITSMMSHQKYFPVVDAAGKLMAHFLTVNNTLARDPSVVTRGNEKVIRARLSDARFFFEEDQKTSLDRRVEDLKKVVYHSLLGTSFDKVGRFRALADRIADRVCPERKATVDRTAWLAKADLDTQMVGEFPELQGVMGREYALLAGEDPAVSRGIYEHYLPVVAGGDLPQTDEGAVVSIADKTDTIVGFFGVNVIPTGAADPYALRRQALGILNIILDRGYSLDLGTLVDDSLAILGPLVKRPVADVKADVLAFFRARFENQLLSQGYAYDVVDAVLAAGATEAVQTLQRVRAMDVFKSHEAYRPLATAFKRAGNIIRDFQGGDVDPALFETDEEKALYEAYLDMREQAQSHISRRDYLKALAEMARIRGPVDAFFEKVLVMAKDERIRFNRLSLLGEISRFFRQVADFSKIVTES
jgi:glycyl-tRNA synthetase beta chain